MLSVNLNMAVYLRPVLLIFLPNAKCQVEHGSVLATCTSYIFT